VPIVSSLGSLGEVVRITIWKAALVAPLGAPFSIVLMLVGDSVASQGLAGFQDLLFAVIFIFVFGATSPRFQ